MADKDRDEMLREMAQHRGFKLVKSRRRKPGVGDYGKYGLADAKTGKPCFGFDKRGLTASADDIASWLRGSVTATWKRSAETTAARPKSRAAKSESEPAPPPAPPLRTRAAKTATEPETSSAQRDRRVVVVPPAPPKPKPAPVLKIRKAGRGDAAAIAALVKELGIDIGAEEIAKRIAALVRAKQAPLVADRDGVIGCLAWDVVATLQRGNVGRITMVVIAEGERRRGGGRALVEAAEVELAKRGCATIEVMSDIAIRNAHGFFRSLGFEQTSYRFARAIAPQCD